MTMMSAFGVADDGLIEKAHPAVAAGVGAGVGAAAVEGIRRYRNRQGANVGPAQIYLRPYNSQHKMEAARSKTRAEKLRGKADALSEGRKKDRTLNRANRSAYAAQAYNAAARDRTGIPGAGLRRSVKEVGWRYHKDRHYDTPTTIGKSAFGVDDPRLIAKADDDNRPSRGIGRTILAAGGGSIAGQHLGGRIAAGGSRKYKNIMAEGQLVGHNVAAQHIANGGAMDFGSVLRATKQGAKSVPGFARTMRGVKIGAAGGALAAGGAYAAHRHNLRARAAGQ